MRRCCGSRGSPRSMSAGWPGSGRPCPAGWPGCGCWRPGPRSCPASSVRFATRWAKSGIKAPWSGWDTCRGNRSNRPHPPRVVPWRRPGCRSTTWPSAACACWISTSWDFPVWFPAWVSSSGIAVCRGLRRCRDIPLRKTLPGPWPGCVRTRGRPSAAACRCRPFRIGPNSPCTWIISIGA